VVDFTAERINHLGAPGWLFQDDHSASSSRRQTFAMLRAAEPF
jgi:hypothetical protein